MSLELPGPAVMAFYLVGLPWPGIDEDVLRAWGKDLRAFSAQVTTSSGRSRDRVAAMAEADPSPPAKALQQRWDHYHGVVSELRGPMEAFAGALDVAADAVVAQKGIVIGAAVALAAEVVADQAAAVETLGLSEAAAAASVAAARFAIKDALVTLEGLLLGKLVGAACSEVSSHLGRAVAQMVEGSGAAAAEVSSLRAAYDQDTLRSLGSSLNGNQADAEAAGAGSHRLASSRRLATGGPGGGWREVAVAVEQAVLRVLTQLFRDLVHALRNVVNDTITAIKGMTGQLERMDAEQPAAGAAVTGAARLAGNGEPGAAAGGMPPTGGTGRMRTGGGDDVPPGLRDVLGNPDFRATEHDRAMFLKANQDQGLSEHVDSLLEKPEYRGIHRADLAAAATYTTEAGSAMNEFLRTGDVQYLHFRGMDIHGVRCAVSGLNQLPKYEGVVSRALDGPPGKMDAIAARYQPGEIVTEPGFTSASKTARLAGSLKFQIYSKNFRDAEGISFNPLEQEAAGIPGSSFKVLENKVDNGTRFIRMVEVGR